MSPERAATAQPFTVHGSRSGPSILGLRPYAFGLFREWLPRYYTDCLDLPLAKKVLMCINSNNYTHSRNTLMRTNIVIDDELMRRAQETTGIKTKREVVETALRLLVRLRDQEQIRSARGRLAWEGDLDRSRSD